MKSSLLAYFLLLCPVLLFGQKELVVETGAASYVSSQNVYVKFANTEHINKGDTLFVKNGEQLAPALLVKDKSSTSCVCALLPAAAKPKAGDAFFAKCLVEKKQASAPVRTPEGKVPRPAPSAPVVADTLEKAGPVILLPSAFSEKEEKRDTGPLPKQKLKGRISAASYSSFYGETPSHRMRYTFNLTGTNINRSRFSTENYIAFRHTLGDWQAVKDNFNNALKVYALSVRYDFDKQSSVTLGRKINQRVASMGAIDGLHFERGLDRILLGAIFGSRPDLSDYRYNPALFQAGAYVGYKHGNKNKPRESTLAVVAQHNHGKVDRRFVYFQHVNTLTSNLSLFGSCEMDFYQNVHDTVTSKPQLTNLLLNLRYRASRKLNLSLAFDSRRNIIFYESYRNFIDQYIENQTRQGLRVGGSYRFSKLLTYGVNASWRFQQNSANASQNINTYLNISRVPGLNAFAALSANFLSTNYLDSRIYGLRLSKEIVRGKLNSELYFRLVDYRYKNYETAIEQKIAGIDLSWYLSRKLALHLYYEGTFPKGGDKFSRFNTRIIQRF